MPYETGDKVWAKLPGYPHWPARVQEPKNMRERKKVPPGAYFIFFYGTHETAVMIEDELHPWNDENREKYFVSRPTPYFADSLYEVENNPNVPRDAPLPGLSGLPNLEKVSKHNPIVPPELDSDDEIESGSSSSGSSSGSSSSSSSSEDSDFDKKKKGKTKASAKRNKKMPASKPTSKKRKVADDSDSSSDSDSDAEKSFAKLTAKPKPKPVTQIEKLPAKKDGHSTDDEEAVLKKFVSGDQTSEQPPDTSAASASPPHAKKAEDAEGDANLAKFLLDSDEEKAAADSSSRPSSTTTSQPSDSSKPLPTQDGEGKSVSPKPAKTEEAKKDKTSKKHDKHDKHRHKKERKKEKRREKERKSDKFLKNSYLDDSDNNSGMSDIAMSPRPRFTSAVLTDLEGLTADIVLSKLNVELMKSLSTKHIDHDRAKTILGEIPDYITAENLKKVPDIVANIKKIRSYKKDKAIAEKAAEIFKNIKTLFITNPDKDFMEQFMKIVEQNKKDAKPAISNPNTEGTPIESKSSDPPENQQPSTNGDSTAAPEVPKDPQSTETVPDQPDATEPQPSSTTVTPAVATDDGIENQAPPDTDLNGEPEKQSEESELNVSSVIPAAIVETLPKVQYFWQRDTSQDEIDTSSRNEEHDPTSPMDEGSEGVHENGTPNILSPSKCVEANEDNEAESSSHVKAATVAAAAPETFLDIDSALGI